MEEIWRTREEGGISRGQSVSQPEEEIVLAFDNLTFGYSEAQTVLEHAQFEVNRGENVAFVVESGGGKSTIFHLLCGFYRAQKGTYRLYGRDFAEWDIDKAREQFALVSQNVFLFPASIEENIRYGRWDASGEEVVAACKAGPYTHLTLPARGQVWWGGGAWSYSQSRVRSTRGVG